jgi:hypothetical protein
MTRKNQVEIEVGGHELLCDFDHSPGDPGVTSGPVESCRESEPEEFSVTCVKLFLGIGANKLPNYLDITNLVEDLDGFDLVEDLVGVGADRLGLFKPDEEGPEPDDLDRLKGDPMYAEPGAGYPK